ncbi:MAG: hypothetical protein DRP57_03835 [Spirochaetes bacterium]|nr:MAG: hypothetical protein DRP57_03835 [Spirochaetota bacterium]
MINDFYREVAGKKIHTGMVIAHQTFGDILRWNPHFHVGCQAEQQPKTPIKFVKQGVRRLDLIRLL